MRPRLSRHRLVEVLALTLAEHHAATTDTELRGLAHSIADRLMARWAGARVPKPQPERDARDSEIRAALVGETYLAVAVRFRLSPGTVVRIAKRG